MSEQLVAKTAAKYPWESWTNGNLWTVYQGVDYSISTFNFQISLHGRARYQNMKVQTSSFTNSDGQQGLVFRFKEKPHEASHG